MISLKKLGYISIFSISLFGADYYDRIDDITNDRKIILKHQKILEFLHDDLESNNKRIEQILKKQESQQNKLLEQEEKINKLNLSIETLTNKVLLLKGKFYKKQQVLKKDEKSLIQKKNKQNNKKTIVEKKRNIKIYNMKIKSDYTKIFSKPHLDSYSLIKYLKGDIVKVIKYNNKWYITDNGKYIQANKLKSIKKSNGK